MSELNTRQATWNDLDQKWDIVVIGGGVTGAGIFNYAARKGLRVLLLEASDFAFGTSSRSSKLVHGGLRYLKNGQFDVVRESVRERERLIREAPGLVNKMSFVYPGYATLKKAHKELAVGTLIYDLLVPKWEHSVLKKDQVLKSDPIIRDIDMLGANQYFDATVDDSRLVLRVLGDGSRHGGVAINYAKVTGLLKNADGEVVGVQVEDQSGDNPGSMVEVQAGVVINATGPWSDMIRKHVDGGPRLRKLRGSHLLFAHERIPLSQSITMIHPRDHRALFIVPWEGTTFIGTTDLDQAEMNGEPRISAEEVDYLLEAANHMLPGLKLNYEDIISTISGLRPVIDSGAATPSQESRRHLVWEENGLVTISGGKLTIFRVMAADCLNFVSQRLLGHPHFDHHDPMFDPTPEMPGQTEISDNAWYFLAGRHGKDAIDLASNSDAGNLSEIEPTTNLWAELAWSAKHNAVVHLDDLLLRRVRLGLYLKHGGMDQIEKIKSLVQPCLNWDEQRWKTEISRYKEIWQKYYYLP
jgi:glycerol-3-phosphate dehydrogenase